MQPTHSITSAARPLPVLAISSGSAISARVIPTRSAVPAPSRRSASARSTTRVLTSSVAPGTAARIAAAGSAIALSGAGGGGAIQVDAAGKAECPRTSEMKSARPAACSRAAISPETSVPTPPGASSSADSRTPTAIEPVLAAALTASSTSIEKRSLASSEPL